MTIRRWAGWIVGGLVVLCLLLGMGRLVGNPDRPQAGGGTVVISEFAAANGGELLDEDGDASDWIELHNRSRRAVNLEGWSLSDDLTQPDKWVLPSLNLAPDEYLLVFASGKDRRKLEPEAGRPYLHTSFRLDAAGGALALYPPTSRRYLDATVYTYPAQLPGLAYGLVQADGRWTPRYLAHPTPGAANDTTQTWTGILPPVTASVDHGFFSAPLTVTLALTLPVSGDLTIRYTTDGSTPTAEQGTLYTGPLTITRSTVLRAAAFHPGDRPSPIATWSYLRVADVLRQPAAPEGWPATWGVHRLDIGDARAGAPVAADYAMDPRIVDDPVDGPLVREGLLALPSLSLVTDPANLDIYADPQRRGPESERPVSVEWIDPGGEPGFQVNAGIRIQGGVSRWEYMPKHSFRLFFRQQYGAATLAYPVFPDSPVREFDTLVLRGGSDRSFAGRPSTPDAPIDQRQTTYVEDEWARASQIALSGYGAHGRFVHLYLNGLYWGLYNLVERPDDAFAAGYLGGDKASWATVNHGGAVGGSLDRFDVLLKLAGEGGLADPAKYATFLEFFDPIQFSDYLILNWYAGNRDWPENNWYVNVANPAGRAQIFAWDAETTWEDGAVLWLGSDGWEGAPYPNVVRRIFLAAWENPEFRLLFADRLYRHLFNDGALTDANAQARWRALADPLESAIAAESARWGDVRTPDRPITVADWRQARDRVLAQMEGNAAKLLRLVRAAGLYPPVDPPAIIPFGGEFTTAITVTLFQEETGFLLRNPVSGDGAIYLTTDGSDPRAPGSGDVAPGAQPYTGPLVLTTTTTVKARRLVDGVWSALAEARFARAGQQAQLVISEIMYHPYLDEEMEFLELHNRGDGALDLAGARFTGIDFRFADGAQIGPGGTMVLVRDLKKFRRRYGDVPVDGVYGGKLSDKGETLTLTARDGRVLAQVSYDDDRGWPLSADGAGDALVLVDGCTDMAQRACWRASATLYGTPGAAAPGKEPAWP